MKTKIKTGENINKIIIKNKFIIKIKLGVDISAL